MVSPMIWLAIIAARRTGIRQTPSSIPGFRAGSVPPASFCYGQPCPIRLATRPACCSTTRACMEAKTATGKKIEVSLREISLLRRSLKDSSRRTVRLIRAWWLPVLSVL